MLVVSRFIYDLAGLPKPIDQELDEEIDRLLYIETAEQPDYLVLPDSLDQITVLDSEILETWLVKKFKPVLILLLLNCKDNYQKSKEELCKMKRYNTLVDKFLRASFLKQHAIKMVQEFYFAYDNAPPLEHSIADLKRLLSVIANHLETNSAQFYTLLGTERYTMADIRFYNFLKRIIVGKYRNNGLAAHIRSSDSLVKFMRRYASKNPNIIDISSGDPLANNQQEPNLLADLVKPAGIGLAVIMCFLYFKRSS